MVNQKLTNIQTQIKAPKNLFNKFGGYYYRNAESICEAVKPYLEKEKCSLKIEDDIVQVGERYYVKASATLTDNEDNSSVTVSAFARESADKKGQDDSQITGSTSSYARKYALNGLFLLDDTKDEDTEELHKEKEQKTKKQAESKSAKVQKETPEEEKLNEEMRNSVDPVYLPTKDNKPSKEQMDKLHSEMERTGVSLEVLLQMYEVKKIEDMNDAMVISALNKFKITGDKQ